MTEFEVVIDFGLDVTVVHRVEDFNSGRTVSIVYSMGHANSAHRRV